MDSSAQAAEPEEEKKGILSAVSMPAILAGVLTSITSFLFSSKLGLTGSLIGAAIAAAVSTTASQLYNAMIKESVEKIQDLSEHMKMHNEETQQTAAMGGIEKTQVRPQPAGYYEPSQTSEYYELETPVAPAELRDEAARRHGATIMRRTFIVAVVAALVALLAYAVIVNVATKGQGIGPTSIEEITQPAPVEETTDTTATDTEAQATQDETAQQTSQTETQATVDPTATVEGTTPSTDAGTTTDTTTQNPTGGTAADSSSQSSTATQGGTTDAAATDTSATTGTDAAAPAAE